MQKLIKKNWKAIIKFSLLFVVLAVASVYASNWLRTEHIQERIKSAGIAGPIIVVLYVIASHVFVPVAGTPGTVIAFAAYGLFGGWLLIYIASLISAIINFYISRNLGRKWVRKLAGENSLNKIDKFADLMGVKLLKIARFFGAPLFEFISYATGFTKISFKKYFFITAVYSLIPSFLFGILIYNSLPSALGLMIFFAGMFTVGGIFSWYVVNKYRQFEAKGK